MNSAGIAGFDATSTNASNGATFSISAASGAAIFKGSIQSGSTISGTTITGSSFQSTNYSTTNGIGIITNAGIDSVNFVNSGSLVASLVGIATGFTISGPAGSTITMPSNGSITLTSAGNDIALTTFATLENGTSGGTTTTGGFHGILRNTWAALNSVTPIGGDPGDVWLAYT
jgi:hypothetical protein